MEPQVKLPVGQKVWLEFNPQGLDMTSSDGGVQLDLPTSALVGYVGSGWFRLYGHGFVKL